jgi:hypothetical protein
MRKYERWYVLGVLAPPLSVALSTGCAGAPPATATVVVESLSIEGMVDGEPIDGAEYLGAGSVGTVFGDTGVFHVPGQDRWLEVAACPIGASPIAASNVNPYEDLSGGSIADPGCAPNLQLCGPDGCAAFGPEDVAFEVTDGERSRLLSLDADGPSGIVHLELAFHTSTLPGSTGSTRP